jgi:hypothetical protein
VLNRLVPTSDQYPLSVTTSKEIGRFFIKSNFSAVRSQGEMMDIIGTTEVAEKLYLRTHARADIKRYYLDVPEGTDAWSVLYAGSECFLFVPNFLPLKSRAKL